MALLASLFKKTFHFRFDARTSRGAMKERTSWFVKLSDESQPEVFGIGECAPLPGLSPELNGDFDAHLASLIESINATPIASCPGKLQDIDKWMNQRPPIAAVSSLRFAMETAMLDLASGGQRRIFENDFLTGKGIPINGLVWMGGMDFMLQEIEIKIRDGFKCIKIKIGGLDFEKECDILQYVRRKYFRDNITIRLDANGAIKADDAVYKLRELSKFGIHSIEQPIKTGHEFLPELCAKTPIPIALDEELIGVDPVQGQVLLTRIKPQFLVLKPTLHGGLSGADRWIKAAASHGIGWWLTSALESNVGLNALAQFGANYPLPLPQGLGTGSLYEDNFPSPIEISRDLLQHNPRETWDLAAIG